MRFATNGCAIVLLLGACSSSSSSSADASIDVTTEAGADTAPTETAVDAVKPDAPQPLIESWIDGDFEEWSALEPLVVDPAGDADGPLDVVALKATSRGSELLLAIELGAKVNLHAGPETDRTLLLKIEANSQLLRIDFRARTLQIEGEEKSWRDVGFLAAPAYASTRFEMLVDLTALGVARGDTVEIHFAGSDDVSPTPFRLVHPARQSPTRPTAREAKTDLRAVSFNVFLDGLIDPARGPSFGRLIGAVAADIYCFQEAYTATASQVATSLEQLDPHGDGAAWNVHKNIDVIIASRAAVHPVPLWLPAINWGAAAVVELSADQAVLVLGIHPPCCGYIGDLKDNARIGITEAFVQELARFRSGAHGAPLDKWRDAPVIVMGDWNMVGSRTPLDLMIAATSPPLEHWPLTHLESGHTYTYREKAWPPAMIDLVVHSPQLQRRNGFVLQSDNLNQATLQSLGLQRDDSLVSDHLLLVADFVINP